MERRLCAWDDGRKERDFSESEVDTELREAIYELDLSDEATIGEARRGDNLALERPFEVWLRLCRAAEAAGVRW